MRQLVISLLFLASPVFSSGDLNLTVSDLKTTTHVMPLEWNSGTELVERIWFNVSNEAPALRKEVLRVATQGYRILIEKGMLREGKPLTVIDFDLPSTDRRLWIIDMDSKSLMHESLVSHGRNSGDLLARKFSNKPESFMSSLGFYLTGERYVGKHGASLRLDGLEKGINDRARSRAIVIHSADYATEIFVKRYGRLGRSLGCPALPKENYEKVIDLIQDKSCLYIHASQETYREKLVLLSHITNSKRGPQQF